MDCNATIYSASFHSKQIGKITYATIGSIKSIGATFKKYGFTKMIIDEAHLYPREADSMLGTFLADSGITEKWRIEKPGKDPEKGRKLDEWKDQNVRCYIGRLMDEDEKAAYKAGQKAFAIAKGEQNRKYREFKRKDSKTFSKGNMAWKNQGH